MIQRRVIRNTGWALLALSGLSLGATALAASPSVDVAVRTLSRYPTGELPDTATVRDALSEVGRRGERGDAAVLQHVIAHEGEALAHVAAGHLATLRSRQRARQRAAFAAAAPQAPTHGASSCRAYASEVLPAGATASGEPTLDDGRRLEDRGDVAEAVQVYARLAGSTEAEVREAALQALDGFGIDGACLVIAGRSPDPDARVGLSRAGYPSR